MVETKLPKEEESASTRQSTSRLLQDSRIDCRYMPLHMRHSERLATRKQANHHPSRASLLVMMNGNLAS